MINTVPVGAALEFQAVEPLGIEYKNEVRVNASARIRVSTFPLANYNFFETVVTLNNLENRKKTIFICMYGHSRAFDHQSTQTLIDMTFDPKTKVLGCAISQTQEMSAVRYGQMGCRQVALNENQRGVAVAFVSGNNRTTIKKTGMTISVDQLGPIQDGLRSAEKIIAAGAAGSGGHPLNTRNTIGGNMPRIAQAIRAMSTRFMMSDDAAVKLETEPKLFHCNRCFGMYSSNDPASTRTDFFLNLPSDALKKQAQLKVATKYESLKEILLAAGERTDVPIDLLNESGDTVFVRIVPKFIDVPSACTMSVRLPEPEPISLPPRQSKPAIVEFDCDSSLPVGATADVILSMERTPNREVLGDYWVKARNSGMCDVDSDGDVDSDDIGLLMSYRNSPAADADDPYDVDGDDMVTVLDARACTLQCTRPHCAR